MSEPPPYDPFVLAVGHVAIATPYFESAMGNLYAVLAGSMAARQDVRAGTYTNVRNLIDTEVAKLQDPDVRAAMTETLSDCDVAWQIRNIVMHGLWVVNPDGYWVTKVSRGAQPTASGGASVDDVMALARDLEQLGYAMGRHARAVIDERRAAEGKPPLEGSGLAWPIDP
jgi:hypothetical protein